MEVIVIVLGLLLLVLSGALGAGVVLSNTDPVSASAFGVSLSNVSVGGLFLLGATTGVVLMLGLVLLVMGAARKRARRVATKRHVRNVRSEKEQLAEENADLRARLGEPYPPTSDNSPTAEASRS
jgi:membrane protein implicated in regulation of membrane protease activity